MKTCPICGQELQNPNTNSHINSKRHQNALKSPKMGEPIPKKGQKTLTFGQSKEASGSEISIIPPVLSEKLKEIDSRLNKIESQLKTFLPPVRKIDPNKFLDDLIKEYKWLNPNNEIHGVELDLLKRRITRNLEISHPYFEDLLHDLLKSEENISLMKERNQERVIIKQKFIQDHAF